MRKHNVLTRLGGRPRKPGAAQRAMRLTLVGLLVLPQAVAPAMIPVAGTDSTIAVDGICSLREAIINANNDDQSGSIDCAKGSGADTITLGADVTLTVKHTNAYGGRGLPIISTDVTIDGGFTIDRDATAANFGIFGVGTNGTLSLMDTTVSGGYLGFANGGGIYIYNRGTTTLTNSTVSGNDVGGVGGGIYNRYGTLTLTNSTVSGNSTVGGGFGGGIYNESGTVMLTNSTVSGNSAAYGGGIYNYGTTTLYNSIVAYSLGGGDCYGGGFIDGGNNFSEDGSCPGIMITPGTDFDITLADNGGPTLTHALLAGSVAIDAVACSLPFDQRGAARSDGLCDSGSYEFGDSDADGVLDNDDLCPGTAIPEGAPTSGFKANRWALVDGDGIFDQAPPQAGSKHSFTIADTGGCSCEQIVVELGLGKGHVKFGCSISAMETWVGSVP